MLNSVQLADVFVDVADTLVDEFGLVDFMHNVTVHAASITDSPGVGMLLSDLRGGLSHVAASSGQAEVLEQVQLQHAEGPGVECYRTGRAVGDVDLGSEPHRWPTFSPRAVAAGIGVVHAFPLRLREDVIGALDVFGAPGGGLDAETARVVQCLADVATIAILQERAIGRAKVLTEQLQHALDSRVVIEQAKGAVARALGVSVDEAFEVLRSRARNQQRGLTRVAQDLLADPAALSSLADSLA